MDRKKPINFFKLFVTNKLANMMVLETSQYANQEINYHLPPKGGSRLKEWNTINAVDMRNFLGIFLMWDVSNFLLLSTTDRKNELYVFPR